MVHSKRNEERQVIAERVKRARKRLPGELSNAADFANCINLSPSELSMIESGKRPLSAEVLERIFRETGISPSQIFGNSVPHRSRQHPIQKTVQFLQHTIDLGIVDVFRDRQSALYALVEPAHLMHSGRVLITGSSLKGLKQDTTHEFVRSLVTMSRDRPHVDIQVIMTHPINAFDREKLEEMPEGSIATEVFEGIRWCIGQPKIPEENIRLMKASPTCFSIFLDDYDKSRRIGLINGYPMMRQAFTSMSFIVEPLSGSTYEERAQSVYQTFVRANFEAAWEDRTGSITVPLEVAIEECLAFEGEGSDLLKRNANSLDQFRKKVQNPADFNTSKPDNSRSN